MYSIKNRSFVSKMSNINQKLKLQKQMEIKICMGCLSSDPSVKTVSGTLEDIYVRLVDKHKWPNIHMCRRCHENLDKINEFREQCLLSSDHLKIVKADKNVYENSTGDPHQPLSIRTICKQEQQKNDRPSDKTAFNREDNICDSCQENDDTSYAKLKPLKKKEKEEIPATFDYLCDFCKLTFVLKKHLIAHMRVHRRFPCKICFQTFKTFAELKVHRKSHPKERTFMCDVCSRCFKSNSDLKIHFHRVHASKQIACSHPDCEKTFGSKYLMGQHVKMTHSREKSRGFVCDFCGEIKKYKQNLKEHIVRVHLKNSKIYSKECPFCLKWFKANSHYTEHVRRHTGEKNHKCDVCKTSFVTAFGLKKHKYSHTNTRPYNCKLCKTGYYHISYLRDHYKRVHNSEMIGYIKKDPE